MDLSPGSDVDLNLLNGNLCCIECESTNLIKDHSRCEIYCADCGLVLMDNSIDNLIDYVPNQEPLEQTKKDYYAMKRFLYNFEIVKGSIKY